MRTRTIDVVFVSLFLVGSAVGLSVPGGGGVVVPPIQTTTPTVFVAGQTALAAEVNGNFETIKNDLANYHSFATAVAQNLSALQGGNIVPGSVGMDQLAADSVNSSKIVDGGVTMADLATDSVGVDQLVASSVSSLKIADGQVALVDLAAGSVDSSKIADGQVGLADLAGNSVNSSKIVDGQVTLADLGPGAVDSSRVVNDSLTRDDLRDEPGVALATRATAFNPDLGLNFITERSMTVPSAGFVLAIGSVDVSGIVDSGAGNVDLSFGFGLGTVASRTTPHRYLIDDDFSAVQSTLRSVVTYSQLFPVTQGTQLFEMISDVLSIGSGLSFTNSSLTLVYLPSSYGAIALEAGDPGAHVQALSSDLEDSHVPNVQSPAAVGASTDEPAQEVGLEEELSVLRSELQRLATRIAELEGRSER